MKYFCEKNQFDILKERKRKMNSFLERNINLYKQKKNSQRYYELYNRNLFKFDLMKNKISPHKFITKVEDTKKFGLNTLSKIVLLENDVFGVGITGSESDIYSSHLDFELSKRKVNNIKNLFKMDNNKVNSLLKSTKNKINFNKKVISDNILNKSDTIFSLDLIMSPKDICPVAPFESSVNKRDENYIFQFTSTPAENFQYIANFKDFINLKYYKKEVKVPFIYGINPFWDAGYNEGIFASDLVDKVSRENVMHSIHYDPLLFYYNRGRFYDEDPIPSKLSFIALSQVDDNINILSDMCEDHIVSKNNKRNFITRFFYGDLDLYTSICYFINKKCIKYQRSYYYRIFKRKDFYKKHQSKFNYISFLFKEFTFENPERGDESRNKYFTYHQDLSISDYNDYYHTENYELDQRQDSLDIDKSFDKRALHVRDKTLLKEIAFCVDFDLIQFLKNLLFFFRPVFGLVFAIFTLYLLYIE